MFTATGSSLQARNGRPRVWRYGELDGEERRSAKIQARAGEGGPRSTCARSRPVRVASRREIRAQWPDTRAGQCAGALAMKKAGWEIAGLAAGNCAHFNGARKLAPGPSFCAAALAQ